MTLHDHSDTDLLALAREGSDSAFAALVHRHAPAVWRLVSADHDPHAVTAAAFTSLVRALAEDVPIDDVAEWVAGHVPQTDNAGASGREVSSQELDAVWSHVRTRWPSGRARVLPSNAIAWIATVVVTIAVSAAVPWLALGGIADEPTIPELRAFPVEETPEPENEPAEVDPPADEPTLPTYEFPVPPEDLEPPDDETPPPDDEPASDATTEDDPAGDTGNANDDPPPDTATDSAETGEASGAS